APTKIRIHRRTSARWRLPTTLAMTRKNPYPSPEARLKVPLPGFGRAGGSKGFRAHYRQDPRIREEWARPDSNRRPSPCQGDVITARPRARCRGLLRGLLKGFPSEGAHGQAMRQRVALSNISGFPPGGRVASIPSLAVIPSFALGSIEDPRTPWRTTSPRSAWNLVAI